MVAIGKKSTPSPIGTFTIISRSSNPTYSHRGMASPSKHNGTLFLDESGDMPTAMQTKLLRVLEESVVERLGGNKAIHVNVRVVVATHRNLEELVRTGTFRQHLYHRVVVFPIYLPPLRQRKEDIPALVDHFGRQVYVQKGWKRLPFTPEAISAQQAYAWPGNIRELRNVVETFTPIGRRRN